MVNIPSDLRKNKETIIGNMDLRESVCLFLGLIIAIGILYYIRVLLGYKNIIVAAFIASLFVVPFLFIGFKRINGMKVEDYFKVFVNNKIIANPNRINISLYTEPEISNKKYELIRYYRLVDKDELLSLRQYLIDKKVLIMTEYIDYKGKQLVIFRLDGKDMILEQKRGKRGPKSKKRLFRIRTFNDLKDEVDIFYGMPDIKAERVSVKINYKKKNNRFNRSDSFIIDLNNECSNEKRRIYQLHLFEKQSLINYMSNTDNKIIFINADNKVDIYTYRDNEKEYEMIDFMELDKKTVIYQNTILSFEARNSYNHYRGINSLEEIL